jgi:hypothetical protein
VRRWGVQLGLGLVLLAIGWGSTLAGVEPVSRYWFTVTWAGWISVADAVTGLRTGGSLLRDHPGRVAALFAASAGFWWLFELVNWHLGNWVYRGDEVFGPVTSLVQKTIAFATVLPALAVMRDLLRSFLGPDALGAPAREPGGLRRAATWMLVLAVLSAGLMWVFPRQAFPLVWVAPFLAVDAVTALRGRPSAIGQMIVGHWRPVLLIMAAGLATGVLWEMWNWGAQPHWEYRVPYVGFGRVFEMPILGYGGYLPFALTADACVRLLTGGWGGLTGDPHTDVGEPARSRVVR